MAVAVVFLPLLAAAIAGFFGRAIGFRGSQLVTCGAMLVSMALGILLFTSILTAEEPQIIPLATWIRAGGVDVDWALKARHAVRCDDPRRDHRLGDGPRLFDRVHGA